MAKVKDDIVGPALEVEETVPSAVVPADFGQHVEAKGGNKFVNCLVRFPCTSAVGIMSLCLITVIATMAVIIEEGADIFGSGANNDLNDVRTQEWEAYVQAKEWVKILGQPDVDSDCTVESFGTSRPCDNRTYPTQTQSGDAVLTVFVAKNSDNLFTEQNLQQIKSVEDTLLNNDGFDDYCLRWDKSGATKSCQLPLSPLRLFYASGVNIASIFDELDELDGQTDDVLEAFDSPDLNAELSLIQRAALESCVMPGCSVNVSQNAKNIFRLLYPLVSALQGPRRNELQDVDKTLKLAAHMKTVGFYAPLVDYYFDKGFSVSNLRSKHSRGVLSYGLPLAGYKNQDDRAEEQSENFSSWFRAEFNDYLQETRDVGDVEVLFFATPLIRDEFLNIIVNDLLKVLVSLGLVFLWIFLQTGSIVIALAGITEIILSIPLAFFFYYYVFGFKYFDGLNAMTIFVVAAIGADDIFVFMDQYKMSSYNSNVCVNLETRMNWVYSRASWAMFITSATTCAAFICTALSPLPGVQSFGVFSAFVIAADYILVITWFPACVILYHNYLEARPCCPCCCLDTEGQNSYEVRCRIQELWPCTRAMQTSTEKVHERGPGDEPKKRMMERFLSGPFAGFFGSKVGARGTTLFFLLLLIPSAMLASQIKPLSRSEENLPADHPFQRLWTVSGEEFPSSAQTQNTPVHVVWGIRGVDTSGINVLRDGAEKRGQLIWDDSFLFDADAQQHIWNICEEVRKMEVAKLEEFLSRDTDSDQKNGWIDCPLDAWKAWLERPDGPGFPLPLNLVNDEMPAFMASEMVNEFNQSIPVKEKVLLGYDEAEGSVRIVMITVKSQLQSRASHTAADLKQNYELFQEWIDEINAPDGRLPAPPSANKAFQTSDGDFNGPNWVWMHTQGLFMQSSISGACVGCILAFIVILVATRQILIASAAFVSIACILVTVIAMMQIAGYEMSTITSICITILAGFAVDYVVHLAHAYNHAEAETRAEKCQEAFDMIGVSVLSGMVTSVLAALALLTCSLQFFAKFGFFLVCTVVWAWLWGNCFFMCLMRLWGPDSTTPWWLQVPNSILPQKWNCKANHESSDA